MNASEKRYLHIIDTTGPGGAETIFIQLANQTRLSGSKTIALIRGPGWVKSELERLQIDVRVMDCKGSFNIKFLQSLIHLIRSEGITHIQSHLLGSNVYASIAGLVCSVPVFSTFHGFVDVSKKERFRFLKFLAIRLGSRKVIAVTDQIRSMLSAVSVLDEKKLMVISNGVDTTVFFPKKDHVQIDRAGVVKIGCLGNVRKAKNYPLAINVVNELKNKGVKVELLIAGDDTTALAMECKQLVEQYHLTNEIKFIGFISDAAEFLNSVDIYLLCSSSEGHPLALTQAMSCGVPIVATKCGIENVVDDGVTALLAENNSCESVVDKIMVMINDNGLANRLANAAVKNANEKWSFASMVREYQNLYNNVKVLS